MEQLGFAQQQGSSGGAALSTSKSSTSFGEEIADSDMNRQGRELTLQLLPKKKHPGQGWLVISNCGCSYSLICI